MSNRSDPAIKYAAVTPSDTTVVNCRALYVGATGSLVLQAESGASSVTFATVPAGWQPVGAYRVMAATTATGIVALY